MTMEEIKSLTNITAIAALILAIVCWPLIRRLRVKLMVCPHCQKKGGLTCYDKTSYAEPLGGFVGTYHEESYECGHCKRHFKDSSSEGRILYNDEGKIIKIII